MLGLGGCEHELKNHQNNKNNMVCTYFSVESLVILVRSLRKLKALGQKRWSSIRMLRNGLYA